MNKLLVIIAVLALPAFSYAAPVQFGRIVDIKGSGFISYEGQTHEIKKGEIINVNSEINIEHSGQVVFTDNADHRFYLGNASSVAVYAGRVELRNGDIWFQSINKMDDYKITSANAVVNYQGGEAIFSYDSDKGKTQLMVINGLMKLSNLRAPELNLTVAEGNFSFVDLDFEEGMPRDPTPVGQKTYGQLVAMFPGVTPMDKHSAEIFKDNDRAQAKTSRGIASAPAHHDEVVNELEKEYKAETLKLKKPAHVVTAPVKKKAVPASSKTIIKIYGLAGSGTSVTTAIYDIPVKEKTRAPASVPETVVDEAVPNADNMNTIPTTPQYKESDKLIEQLNKL